MCLASQVYFLALLLAFSVCFSPYLTDGVARIIFLEIVYPTPMLRRKKRWDGLSRDLNPHQSVELHQTGTFRMLHQLSYRATAFSNCWWLLGFINLARLVFISYSAALTSNVYSISPLALDSASMMQAVLHSSVLYHLLLCIHRWLNLLCQFKDCGKSRLKGTAQDTIIT